MGTVVGLPMMIFAVLFVIGIGELIIAFILYIKIAVKRIKKEPHSKANYVAAILLTVIGIGSVLPLIGTKAFFKETIDIPETKNTVNIKIGEDSRSFLYHGVKYPSIRIHQLICNNPCNANVHIVY